MTPDHINGCFEGLGALFNAWNCWTLYQHKQVRGVSVGPSIFFSSWGVWNLKYYLSLTPVQWWSWSGGCVLTTFSLLWLFLAFVYLHRENPLQCRLRLLLQKSRSLTNSLTKATPRQQTRP